MHHLLGGAFSKFITMSWDCNNPTYKNIYPDRCFSLGSNPATTFPAPTNTSQINTRSKASNTVNDITQIVGSLGPIVDSLFGKKNTVNNNYFTTPGANTTIPGQPAVNPNPDKKAGGGNILIYIGIVVVLVILAIIIF